MKTIKKQWMIGLFTMMLVSSLTACGKKTPATTLDVETKEVTQDEQTNPETPTQVEQTENDKATTDETLGPVIQYAGTYWTAVYQEFYAYEEGTEPTIYELPDEDHAVDVFFYEDGTAFLRNVIGNQYAEYSCRGDWREDGFGGVRFDNIVSPEGEDMEYFQSFLVPHFYPAGDLAPHGEKDLIAMEYMDMCLYFKQATPPETDPYDGIDLSSVKKTKDFIKEQELDGEWVLYTIESEGETVYALDEGIQCSLELQNHYLYYSYQVPLDDGEAFYENYYYIPITLVEEKLTADSSCEYKLYAEPGEADLSDWYDKVTFEMAPEGEYLIVYKYNKMKNSPEQTWNLYKFQRGWG